MVTEIGILKRWHNTEWPCSTQASCSLVVIILYPSRVQMVTSSIMSSAVRVFLCPMLLTINIPTFQRWYYIFTDLHFKHNTVCQLTTDVKLLQSPFEDNGDPNILTFPQGKCDSQIKKCVYYHDQVFLFFFYSPPWISSKAKFG